ncbi:DUF2232 domain-containing protein [Chengkuizengella axinellae]|uniref:DUF2232 domain-containing protein n=1 Tax=Chengkuizengella axinellae TaxID=3064388 RepID=A0ABT9J355_9BACL|nr:DUF2232 domain-containing protein [Chengkuizengella sp. 2205SS18-9]MDP5276061.1 DUF2232 domain-containing protein [Chengkuizengella sp. 2205SS18-9]
MSKYSWKSLIWSIAFILILISLITPLSIFTFSMMLVPAIVLFVILERKHFVIQYIVSIIGTCLLFPDLSIGIVLLSLFISIPSVIMGSSYKKGSAGTALFMGIISVLVLFISTLFLGSLLGFNAVKAMEVIVIEVTNEYPEFSQIATEETLLLLKNMLPFYLIMSASLIVAASHFISRLILQKMDIHIPKLKSIKDWKLPKSLVWYYFAALLLQLIMNPEDGSYALLITVNLIPLLSFVFCLQAFSFLFFIADKKGWKFLPYLGIILSPFLTPIFSFIGMLDIAFDIRKGMTSR